MISIVNIKNTFGSSFEEVDNEVNNIFDNLKKDGTKIDSKTSFIIQFAIRELFNNAVEHGNNFDPQKVVQYSLNISTQHFEIEVMDNGEAFDIKAIMLGQRKDSLIRQRNRGLTTLEDMGFFMEGGNKRIYAKLLLKEGNIYKERMVDNMKVTIENEIAYCMLNKSLISTNVKDLVESVKVGLEDEASFKAVVIDLSSSENIDSMGITFLIGVYKTILAKGKTISLKGVSEEMYNLFKIMKLDEIFVFEK